ncbi:unnamed protein product [Discosporangium mesarthrocarpum]
MTTAQDEHWVETQKARIREAFALFDKEKKGCVIQEEVPTIMRFLGAYPTERAMVKDILPDMQEDEPTAYVTFQRFEEKMLEILASRVWEPDPAEILLQAFRVVDEEGLGYIDTATMGELLMTKGTPFREKEMEAFTNVAKDVETGRIYYEDYVASLMAET